MYDSVPDVIFGNTLNLNRLFETSDSPLGQIFSPHKMAGFLLYLIFKNLNK